LVKFLLALVADGSYIRSRVEYLDGLGAPQNLLIGGSVRAGWTFMGLLSRSPSSPRTSYEGDKKPSAAIRDGQASRESPRRPSEPHKTLSQIINERLDAALRR